MMIDKIMLYILHFDTSLIDFDLDSRSQECEKAKTTAPDILQSFCSIWMEWGLLSRLVGVMNLIHILSYPVTSSFRLPKVRG